MTRYQIMGAKRSTKSIELAFGKNVITWNGGALSIKGKGYKVLKALYDADKMRLREATLGKHAWGQEPTHKAFRELIRELSVRLEKAKFPYRLLPLMSKEKTVPSEEHFRSGKPKLKHLRPVIIGVKLTARVNSGNLAVNNLRSSTMSPVQATHGAIAQCGSPKFNPNKKEQ